MNKKTLIILFVIFIFLGVVASFSWWSKCLRLDKKTIIDTELSFSMFTKGATSKISILKEGEEEKIIKKENGLWKINGFDASQKAIDDFFKALSELSIKSLVSRNPENHANFEIDEKNGITLTMVKDNIISTFIIGRQSTTFNSFYAKIKGGNNVYEVSGMLRDKLLQSVTFWRDKIIVNVPREIIQKIEVVSDTNPLTVTKNKDIWTAKRFDKTAILDEATANRLIATFNPLEASGFLNEEKQKEFQNAKDKIIIFIYGSDNKPLAEINLFEKDDEWWGQVDGKDIFYTISPYKFSDVLLKDEDIFGVK